MELKDTLKLTPYYVGVKYFKKKTLIQSLEVGWMHG